MKKLLILLLFCVVFSVSAQNKQIVIGINGKTYSVVKGQTNITSTVSDVDGNLYYIVRIGDLMWMADNLKTTHFNDGSPITTSIDSLRWLTLTTAAYCWYKNDSVTYKPEYGALYNWYAANNDKLCPTGWRVPTLQDYQELARTVDPAINTVSVTLSEIAGGFIKEAGNDHWPIYEDAEVICTNSTGFTALPGGCRGWSGWYNSMPYFGYFWCQDNWSISLRWATNRIFVGDNVAKYVAISIRCVKDYEIYIFI